MKIEITESPHLAGARATCIWLVLATASACSSTLPIEADSSDPYAGQWGMTTQMGGAEVSALLTLARDDDGALFGNWESRGQDMDLLSISTANDLLVFERELPGGQRLHFTGVVSGEQLDGAWTGPFGELPCSGTRDSIVPFPDRHTRPLIDESGTTLLWARDTEDGEPEWFDVTDARIDPVSFQFGIGKDTIASIEDPEFVLPTDPLLAERGVDPETEVLGVLLNGVARAYPVDVMSMHEVVNDDFSGEAFAVLW